MDNKDTPCGNPECTELGKLKCSGCSGVTYCSPACQKKHWPSHKTTCKSSSSKDLKSLLPTSVTQTVSSDHAGMITKLTDIKAETQKAFMANDFPLSITRGLEAMELARQLPASAASGEIIQLHLNLASAYMHTKNNDEAISHSNAAVTEAEVGVSNRQGQPQAVEILTVALGSKAFTLLNIGVHLDQAVEAAQRSLALSETIYPKNDPRLHKPLRALALVREKSGDTADAEKLLMRAYTILCLTQGAHSREAQMLLDDLIGMCMRKNDIAGAEKHANKNYQALKGKTDDKEVIVLADSASRLANILRKQGRDEEAEELILQALAIREKFVPQIGPMGVAFTLIQLAQAMEAQGKYGDELEAKLMRALDIFGRVQGQNSPEVMNTLQSLRNVRLRRKERETTQEKSGRVSELGDGDEEDTGTVTSENKVPTRSDSKQAMSSSSSSGRLDSPSNEDLDAKMVFAEDDAIGRMMQANRFFETQKFSHAERLIAEAYAIFLRQNGPDHPSTQAAQQNLGVVRNNSLNQLWMQVVTEEVLKLDEGAQQQQDAADGKKASKGGTDTSANSTSEGAKAVDEYARLMAKSTTSTGRPEDQWLSAPPASSGGCTIC